MRLFGKRLSADQIVNSSASDEPQSSLLKLKQILAILDANDEQIAAVHLQAAIDSLNYTVQELASKKI